MRIALVGPGRAGTALALAIARAGHDVIAVAARDFERARSVAGEFGAAARVVGDPIPPVDLVIVAVRDDAIAEVAEILAPTVGDTGAVVHLSGATPVDVLAPIAAAGVATGSFHPLQTLPGPQLGAANLKGAWIAVTAEPPLRTELHELARSIGAHPFDLEDADKPAYHAAASAAANFPVAALAISRHLFEQAGVPFEAARPLVEAGIANAFAQGPDRALTGPVARGDVETVRTQLLAVDRHAPHWRDAYRALVTATAEVAATGEQFEDLL